MHLNNILPVFITSAFMLAGTSHALQASETLDTNGRTIKVGAKLKENQLSSLVLFIRY